MHISTAHVMTSVCRERLDFLCASRFPRVCFFTTASERHFVFHVRHGVFVPFCPCWTLCPSLEPDAGAARLVEELDRSTAYKTDVYFFPKMLRERVATLHLSVLGSALTALTQELVLPLEFYGQFYVILHVSRFQILCRLQFCLSSTSCAVQFPSLLQDIYAMACGTPFLRRAESCLPDNRESYASFMEDSADSVLDDDSLSFHWLLVMETFKSLTLLSSFVIMFVMMLMLAMCVACVWFIPSSLASYIERSRNLHIHGVPYSCTTDRSSYCFLG